MLQITTLILFLLHHVNGSFCGLAKKLIYHIYVHNLCLHIIHAAVLIDKFCKNNSAPDIEILATHCCFMYIKLAMHFAPSLTACPLIHKLSALTGMYILLKYPISLTSPADFYPVSRI